MLKEEDKIALTECDDLDNNRHNAEDDGDNDAFEPCPKDRRIGIKIQNLKKIFKTEAGRKGKFHNFLRLCLFLYMLFKTYLVLVCTIFFLSRGMCLSVNKKRKSEPSFVL